MSSPTALPEIQVNDTVRLRKPHPCGESQWRVVRVGADIGLSCVGCGRRVLLSRHELGRRLKSVVSPDSSRLGDNPASGDRAADASTDMTTEPSVDVADNRAPSGSGPDST